MASLHECLTAWETDFPDTSFERQFSTSLKTQSPATTPDQNGPGNEKHEREFTEHGLDGLPTSLNERHQGRAAILEIGRYDKAGPRGFTFFGGHEAAGPSDLLERLRYSQDKPDPSIAGTVIILEGLGYEWVNAIHKGLQQISLDFFARHWANPTLHNRGVARPPLAQDPHYQCVLSYSQLHDARLSHRSETAEFYRLRGSAYRTISFGQDEPSDDHPDDYGASGSRRSRSRQSSDYTIPQPAVSQQLISYWGTEHRPSLPWTAVILVDPPLHNDLNRAVYYESEEGKTRYRNWMPCEFARVSIPPLPKLAPPLWSDDQPMEAKGSRQRPMREPKRLKGWSMFNDLVTLLGGEKTATPAERDWVSRSWGGTTTDPKVWDVAKLCCRMVMAKTAVEMQKIFGEAYRLKLVSALELDLRDIAAFNFNNFDRRAWNLEWEGRRFTRLWKKREELELLRYRLRLNTRTVETLNSDELDPGPIATETSRTEIRGIHAEESVRMGNWNTQAKQEENRGELSIRPRTTTNIDLIVSDITAKSVTIAYPYPDRRQGEEQAALGKEELVRRQNKLDLIEWENLELTANFADETIKRTTESYLQTVAACQASAASAQANFVGQITKMASVFVPVSLIAAIFSMGGSFAAGSALFWVFWAVSMPVAVGLIAWMFGKDIWSMFMEYVIKTIRFLRLWFRTKPPGGGEPEVEKRVPFGIP